MRTRTFFQLMIVTVCAACQGEGDPPAPAPVPAVQSEKPAPPSAPAATAQGEKSTAPADPNEACGQIIVSAYKGAKFAGDDVSRSADGAKARAQAQLDKLAAGADFAALAKAESEAPTSAPRGGVMGTFARQDWPEIHGALAEPLFALRVGEVAASVVETPYGFVVLKRCPVEKAHGRHILIRYRGAKRAGDDVTRSKDAARKEAESVLQALGAGQDFEALARERSEDSSAERGGDIGSPGRGRLALPFEQALFGMKPGDRSDVVETEFGYHIIERLPDP